MIFFYSIYAMFCVWMAYRDASLIKKDRPVDHIINGATHLTAAALVGFIYGWYHFIGILCLSRLVFDTSLNIFRHFNPFHVSPSPSSFIDKIEKKIFGNSGLLPKAIYLSILILIWIL